MWGLGTVLGDRYTLAERLGGGAMGEVWRAQDGVLGRQVAVKILLPALLNEARFADRFRREAKVLAALDHVGIVDVHDYGESGSQPRVAYIVMELVVGRPLDVVRADDDGAAMPVERALGIVAQALDALHAAHGRGIVHRDIKPSNLMIGDDDRVTVTDFGIAHTTAETRLTASHAVLGTARYIAPEQALGDGAVPASDQYAMGVVCYELLTGEPLFGGDAVFEVVLKHIREPAPELPAEFPRAVRAFVAKALAKAPKDRYTDAAAMAAAARAAMTRGRAAAVAGLSGGAAGASVEVTDADGVDADGAAGVGPMSEGADHDAVVPAPAEDTLPPAVVPVAAPAEPGPDTRDAATSPGGARAWKRTSAAAALLVAGVVAGVVATVVFVDPFDGGRSDTAQDAKADPSVSGSRVAEGGPSGDSAGPGAGPGAAPGPSGSANASSAPTKGVPPGDPTAKPAAGRTPGAPEDVSRTAGTTTSPVPPPAGGGNGTAGGNGTGTDTGTGTGTGTNPKPSSTPKSPAEPIPQGCGGDRWGAITSVADGLAIGLLADGPDAGTEVIMGGHTRYGWAHAVDVWDSFSACSLSGPALGQPYADPARPELAATFGHSINWRLVTVSSPNVVYIKDYQGQKCLTHKGARKALSVEACTPGNKFQQWRIP